MTNVLEDQPVPIVVSHEITEEEVIENINRLLEQTQEVIDKIPDEEIRDHLRKNNRDIERNCNIVSKKLATSEQKEMEYQQQIEGIRLSMEIERSRNTANLLNKLLEKEVVATLIGAVLLLMLIIIFAKAMISGIPTSDILNNAFLLILGYFFGQTTSKSSSPQKPE
jgi:Fe2+ transport system protein B